MLKAVVFFTLFLSSQAGAMMDPGGGGCSGSLENISKAASSASLFNFNDSRTAAAEFILMLSYDHPMFTKWIQRSSDAQDIEAALHLTWGYSLPIYVDPRLEIAYGKFRTFYISPLPTEFYSIKTFKQAYDAYTSGRFQFPIDQIRIEKPTRSWKRHDTQEYLQNLVWDLSENYSNAIDWLKWKNLSIQHRRNFVENLLKNIERSFSSELTADSQKDPRTGEAREHLTYVYRSHLASDSTHKTTPISIKRGLEYDSFLPKEFYSFRKLANEAAKSGSNINILVKEYLIQHLPLLLQRRAEAMDMKEPIDNSNSMWINPLQASIKRSAINAALFEKSAQRNKFSSYLTQLELPEIKQKILKQDSPLQARIRLDMSMLIKSPESLKTPPEMQDHPVDLSSLETPADYDIAKQLMNPSPEKIITEKSDPLLEVTALQLPDEKNFGNTAVMQNFNQELDRVFNVLSATLGSLNTDIDRSMQAFLDSEIKKGIIENSLSSMMTILTNYRGHKSFQFGQLVNLEQGTNAFLSILKRYLSALETSQQSAEHELSDSQKFLLNSRIETLQNMVILIQSQMLTAFRIKSSNYMQTRAIVETLVTQIATLQTKRSISPLTYDDLGSLQKNLELLKDALK